MNEQLTRFDTQYSRRLRIDSRFFREFKAANDSGVIFNIDGFEKLADEVGIEYFEIILNSKRKTPIHVGINLDGSTNASVTQVIEADANKIQNPNSRNLPHYARKFGMTITINPDYFENQFIEKGRINYKGLNNPKQFANALNKFLKSKIWRQALRHNTLGDLQSTNVYDIHGTFMTALLSFLIIVALHTGDYGYMSYLIVYILLNISDKFHYKNFERQGYKKDNKILSVYGLNPEKFFYVLNALINMGNLVTYESQPDVDAEFEG